MKFVITQKLSDDGMQVLYDSGAEVYVADNGDPHAYIDQLEDADAFIVRIGKCPADIIDSCKNLKVIGKTGVGYDSIDVDYAAEKGIPVVFTPGANPRSVAEHTAACMFALAKNLKDFDAGVRNNNWQIRDTKRAFELYGKTIGIIGLGAIGAHVAEICKGIGMNIAAYDQYSVNKIKELGYKNYDNLDDLLRDCDIVTVHVPLTPETENMISAREMALMKPHAILINVSRGGIINENDLADALKKGIVGGAALDVFGTEPPDVEADPVFSAPNVICTPHTAGISKESFNRMSVWCAEGCLAVLRGEKWKNVVKPSAYDNRR